MNRLQLSITSWFPLGLRWFARVGCILGYLCKGFSQIVSQNKLKRDVQSGSIILEAIGTILALQVGNQPSRTLVYIVSTFTLRTMQCVSRSRGPASPRNGRIFSLVSMDWCRLLAVCLKKKKTKKGRKKEENHAMWLRNCCCGYVSHISDVSARALSVGARVDLFGVRPMS